MTIWQVLPYAIALVFVIEGLVLALSPRSWREMVRQIGQWQDSKIRLAGILSMLFGLLILIWMK